MGSHFTTAPEPRPPPPPLYKSKKTKLFSSFDWPLFGHYCQPIKFFYQPRLKSNPKKSSRGPTSRVSPFSLHLNGKRLNILQSSFDRRLTTIYHQLIFFYQPQYKSYPKYKFWCPTSRLPTLPHPPNSNKLNHFAVFDWPLFDTRIKICPYN